MARKSYYARIGYLTQEPSIFDGSIRENLLFSANRDCSDAEIYAALEQACCDFVDNQHVTLETEIGERGIRLSGGQRQRLAIAKLFLKNPEIVFLDEPTATLDSFSEEHVTQALDHLFQNRTVIIVAHRLQTVKQADEILVLKGGAICERGNHAELIAKQGVYAQMVELQSGF